MHRMLVDANGQPTRVGFRANKEGNTERYSIKTGNAI